MKLLKKNFHMVSNFLSASDTFSLTRSEKFNYIFYDDELHWCKTCRVFPSSAKEYLEHLHTPEHLEKITRAPEKAPWRAQFEKCNEIPSHPNAPTKRTAIKGLQFFEPATAWFCKLCEQFMGDTSCASIHLKSEIHMEKYAVSVIIVV